MKPQNTTNHNNKKIKQNMKHSQINPNLKEDVTNKTVPVSKKALKTDLHIYDV